jgi:hypothetical protein
MIGQLHAPAALTPVTRPRYPLGRRLSRGGLGFLMKLSEVRNSSFGSEARKFGALSNGSL